MDDENFYRRGTERDPLAELRRKIAESGDQGSGSQGGSSTTPQTAEIKALANYEAANSRVTGGGVYEVGSTVTLSANSNSQWQFIRWQKEGGGTFDTSTIEITVPAGGATYTAHFESV